MLQLKSIYTAACFSIILSCGNLNEVIYTAGGEILNPHAKLIPNEHEMISGLKEALVKGTEMGVSSLSQSGGYLDHPSFKIPFPTDAQKMEQTLRDIGLGSEVDKVVVSLNRAAENAVTEAKPLFVNAIKEMSFQDVKQILLGTDTAATAFLRSKTSIGLKQAFEPKIKTSLDQVNATKYWEDIVLAYNKVPFVTKMNPDLSSFVTDQAIKGLFMKIAEEEIAIRENPLERTSLLLKKVFDYADSEKKN